MGVQGRVKIDTGGRETLPDSLEPTAEVVRGMARKVLGVTSVQRNEDKEGGPWGWNDLVQEPAQWLRWRTTAWKVMNSIPSSTKVPVQGP